MTQLYLKGTAAQHSGLARYHGVLSGDVASLVFLSQCFTHADCRVVKHEHSEKHLLLSSRLELPSAWKEKISELDGTTWETDESEIEAEGIANQIVNLMNGAARLLLSNFSPVSLDFVACPDHGGGHVKLSVSIASHRSPSEREACLLRQWLRAGVLNSRIETAFHIIGAQNLTWPNLYVIFELIKWDLERSPVDLSWITKKEQKDFKTAANTSRSVEEGMRHGGKPPSGWHSANGLALDEGRHLIKQLLVRWLAEAEKGSDAPWAG